MDGIIFEQPKFLDLLAYWQHPAYKIWSAAACMPRRSLAEAGRRFHKAWLACLAVVPSDRTKAEQADSTARQAAPKKSGVKPPHSVRLWAHLYRAVKVRFGQTLSGP